MSWPQVRILPGAPLCEALRCHVATVSGFFACNRDHVMEYLDQRHYLWGVTHENPAGSGVRALDAAVVPEILDRD